MIGRNKKLTVFILLVLISFPALSQEEMTRNEILSYIGLKVTSPEGLLLEKNWYGKEYFSTKKLNIYKTVRIVKEDVSGNEFIMIAPHYLCDIELSEVELLHETEYFCNISQKVLVKLVATEDMLSNGEAVNDGSSHYVNIKVLGTETNGEYIQGWFPIYKSIEPIEDKKTHMILSSQVRVEGPYSFD